MLLHLRNRTVDKVVDLVRHPELVMEEKPAAIFKSKPAKPIEVLSSCSIVLSTRCDEEYVHANSLMLRSSCSSPPTLARHLQFIETVWEVDSCSARRNTSNEDCVSYLPK